MTGSAGKSLFQSEMELWVFFCCLLSLPLNVLSFAMGKFTCSKYWRITAIHPLYFSRGWFIADAYCHCAGKDGMVSVHRLPAFRSPKFPVNHSNSLGDDRSHILKFWYFMSEHKLWQV